MRGSEVIGRGRSLEQTFQLLPLKHCIHFLRSILCPPTSNILKVNIYHHKYINSKFPTH